MNRREFLTGLAAMMATTQFSFAADGPGEIPLWNGTPLGRGGVVSAELCVTRNATLLYCAGRG